MDYVSIHWYLDCSNPNERKQKLEDSEKKRNKVSKN